MRKLKTIFTSKGSNDDPPDSSKPLSQPVLPPGVYGHFPAVFTITFAWNSDDKKSSTFFVKDESKEGQAVRLYAFSMNRRKIHHSLTLFNGTDVDSSSPLALAGGTATQSSSFIALPGLNDGGISAPENRIERLENKGSLRSLSELFCFSIPVGSSGNVEVQQQIESFEWRGDSALNKRNGNPLERRLIRLESTTTQGQEVVGVWTDDVSPLTGNKLGTFQFLGSGATGELGEYWTLMAVMSLIRILEVRYPGAEGVSGMASRARPVGGNFLI